MSPRKKVVASTPVSTKAAPSRPSLIYPTTDARDPPVATLPDNSKRTVFTVFGKMDLSALTGLLVTALSKTKEKGVAYVQLDEALGETQAFIRNRFPLGPEEFVAICLTGTPALVDSLIQEMRRAARTWRGACGAWESPAPHKSLSVRAVVVDQMLVTAADEELFLAGASALAAQNWDIRLIEPMAFAFTYATEAP